MSWTDLAGEFNFGDGVPAAEINQLHDNFTAVCSGEASTPKFNNKAMSHGPAIGENAPVTAVNSMMRNAALQGHVFDTRSFSFFPNITVAVNNTNNNSSYLTFSDCRSVGSVVAFVNMLAADSGEQTFFASRALEY